MIEVQPAAAAVGRSNGTASLDGRELAVDPARDATAGAWWNAMVTADPIAAGLAVMLLQSQGRGSCIDEALRRARRAMRFAHGARASQTSDSLRSLGDAIVASYFTAKATSRDTRGIGWMSRPVLAAALRRKVAGRRG